VTIRRVLTLLLAVAFFGCMTEGVGRRGGLKPDVVQSYPADVQYAYEIFEHKCSRCHTLARPLNAPIYEFEHWQAYVARMRRQPGSGISESDGETILIFLKYYAEKKKRDKALGTELETTTTTVAQGGAR
jgi:hypothetical protein